MCCICLQSIYVYISRINISLSMQRLLSSRIIMRSQDGCSHPLFSCPDAHDRPRCCFLPLRRQLMQQLSPGVALTHVAIDEVLNLLRTSSTPAGHRGHPPPSLTTRSKRSPSPTASSVMCSTGSLPRGMRAWIEGDWLLVEAGAISRSKSNTKHQNDLPSCLLPTNIDKV